MRRDFHIENEANLFLLYAIGGGAPDRAAIIRNLGAAAREGWAAPVELAQDDSFNIRFVDEDLSDHEQTEWVGRIEWNLRVPLGVLALQASLEQEVESASGCVVEVPPGDYRVSVYAYLPGVNGLACLRAAGHQEPLGQWFRRTRPGEPMPAWLTVRLAEAPSEDPGHEQEWESFLVTEAFAEAQRLDARNPALDFVVHLRPLDAGQPCRNKGRARARPYDTEVREPQRFPLGLAARELTGRAEQRFVFRPRSPEAGRLLETVPEATAPIRGGAVRLPLDRIHHLARIPAWCNELSWALLLVEPPREGLVPDLGITPTYYLGTEDAPRSLLVSLKPKDKLSIADALQRLGQTLARLADGTALELITGDYAGASDAGNHRYRGTVRNGSWVIASAHPEVERAVLHEALEFARHLDQGRVQARDPAEAARILKVCRTAFPDWYDAIKPAIEGATITLESGDAGELWNVARYAFAMRYADTWAAWDWWDSMFPGTRPDQRSD